MWCHGCYQPGAFYSIDYMSNGRSKKLEFYCRVCFRVRIQELKLKIGYANHVILDKKTLLKERVV